MPIKFNQKIVRVLLCLVLCSPFFFSCKDDYIYDDREPDNLNASIYDYLKSEGDFTYFLRLIDDMGYTETLSRTGSKTLLPARDEAFERFFKNNSYGVAGYDDLTPVLKRMIMNSSMINMAYLSYMLSNVGSTSSSSGEGLAMRINSSNTFIDNVPFYDNEDLFNGNIYWKRFAGKGLYLSDNGTAPLVHFTPSFMSTLGVTSDDFSVFSNGKTFTLGSDIYINDTKVVQADIICKNGYIHIMEDLLLPLDNMDKIIENDSQTRIFSSLMSRFCAPYYDPDIEARIRSYYDGTTPDKTIPADSIFIKKYFTESNAIDPYEKSMENYGLLYFDPADNSYPSSAKTDIGVMFVPTDEAMDNYMNGTQGAYLKDVYGSWENVPTDLLALFIKNHQKRSFTASLPHTWETMTDESSFDMNVSRNDVVRSYWGCNGIVYVTNKVYPPIDYQSVYGSAMASSLTQVMKVAIKDTEMKFFYFLRSMENRYNLLVPTDAAMKNYRDPISWGLAANGEASDRQIWDFYLENNQLRADIYASDALGNKGAKIKTIGKETDEMYMIRNRLSDLLDMHIIVADKENDVLSGDIDEGMKYAMTKGGSVVKINGTNDAIQLAGGGNMESGQEPATIVHLDNGSLARYESDNGRTFFIDHIMQDPFKSVYTVLKEHDEYKAFFELCEGNSTVFSYFKDDEDIVPVFDRSVTQSSAGLGYVVKSFNNFRYTVFVPTAEALRKAFDEDPDLCTWEEINAETDPAKKKTKCLYLLNFLKYHFMDNLVPVSGKPFGNLTYETASRTPSGKFNKVTLYSNTGNDLNIECTDTGVKASVVTADRSLYNVLARDYIVDNSDIKSATNILSSSRVVIHQIDHALKAQ